MSNEGFKLDWYLRAIIVAIEDARKPHKKMKLIKAGEQILLTPVLRQLTKQIRKIDLQDFTQYGLDKWLIKTKSEFLEKMPIEIERYYELALPKGQIASNVRCDEVGMRGVIDFLPGTDEEWVSFDILFTEMKEE